MRFVLIRHGEADGNQEMRYLGTTDAPLTPLGQVQAAQLARAAGVFHVTAIYTSPLVRARQTAEALAALYDLRMMEDGRLREEAFGDWENRTRAEVQATAAVQLAAWESGDETAPPGGESLAQVRERVLACADALAAAHPGQTVALVSHVGPIKLLVCAALGLPPSGARRMWLDPASICVVDWRPAPEGSDPGQRTGVLRVYNAVAHLDPPVRWIA
jgi:probable phosphoglycerate mutase